jgi:AhpD family alkylhydroperoxidase
MRASATLDGYLGLSGALVKGTLPAKVREQLALAVSEANGCDCCLAAHSTAGKAIGLTPGQIRDARLGGAWTPGPTPC